MEELKAEFAKLTDKLSSLEASVTSINERLEPTVSCRPEVQALHASLQASAGTSEPQAQPVSGQLGSYSDLQAEYKGIHESVAKLKLPLDLVVGDSRAGVGKADVPRFQVIQKCARFQETALKILSTAKLPIRGTP